MSFSLAVHFIFFSLHHPAISPIYTLSLHDALPISPENAGCRELLAVVARYGEDKSCKVRDAGARLPQDAFELFLERDRKSTRLNSSHRCISYAVFCLKKKKKKKIVNQQTDRSR